jgi:hypothetical protein
MEVLTSEYNLVMVELEHTIANVRAWVAPEKVYGIEHNRSRVHCTSGMAHRGECVLVLIGCLSR